MEIWKDILGFEGRYEASNTGSVRSVPRPGQPRYQKLKAADRSNGGYGRLVLTREDGKRCNVMLHKAVLEAFGGPRPDGALVRHIDGDKTNNHIENLTWGTHKENQADRVLHGTHSRGENNPSAYLTEVQVTEIRNRRASGAPLKDLSVEFGVTLVMVSSICTGKSWAHAPGPIVESGSVNCRRAVTDDQVIEIRHRRAAGGKLKELAVEFGVDHGAIASICLGKVYKHLGGPRTRVKPL